ncbi:MAG: deoxyribonuclease IV [Planctomycetota bacterium]|jgi:deoxyribonuclease-4
MRFGLHVSIEGSFAEAPRRAKALGCDCFQIFAGPPRNFSRRKPSRAERDDFRGLVREHDLRPVVVHAGYLLHLLSRNPRVAAGSRELMGRELAVASALDADYYVMHLGSAGEDRARSLDVLCRALSALPAGGPAILLENSAHAATGVGADLRELGGLARRLDREAEARFGIALDTAHAVGAGYDLSSPGAVARSLRRIFRAVGRRRLKIIHANDSRAPLGSGRDLHEHVGRGHIGREGFRALLADRTLARVPFILETPVDRPGDDKRNLARLRRLAGLEGPRRGRRRGK